VSLDDPLRRDRLLLLPERLLRDRLWWDEEP
jgi:hypothetical protein